MRFSSFCPMTTDRPMGYLRQGGERIEDAKPLDLLLAVNQLHDVCLAVFFHEHGPFHWGHRTLHTPLGVKVLHTVINRVRRFEGL